MNQPLINQKYNISTQQLLGKGSTGNVYLSHPHQHPQQKLAIKVIDARALQNEVTRYLLNC